MIRWGWRRLLLWFGQRGNGWRFQERSGYSCCCNSLNKIAAIDARHVSTSALTHLRISFSGECLRKGSMLQHASHIAQRRIWHSMTGHAG